MTKISYQLAFKLFITVICALVIGFCVLNLVHNNEQKEQAKFNIMWNDMVDTTDSTPCTCFNCTNHISGYIPPITLEQIQGNHNLDWPEELPSLGDTIALNTIGDSTYMCYYHLDYPQKYYEDWSIYIISQYPE